MVNNASFGPTSDSKLNPDQSNTNTNSQEINAVRGSLKNIAEADHEGSQIELNGNEEINERSDEEGEPGMHRTETETVRAGI